MPEAAIREELAGVTAEIIIYSQQVSAGAKLAAQMMVRHDYVVDIAEIVHREGCRTAVCPASDGWDTLSIYKYPFVRLLIEEMQAESLGQERPSLLSVWSTGKLFGYSDYEIARFLEEHGYVESALT
jgi:hypothetical protein